MDELEANVSQLIKDLMKVLYKYGIEEIPMGAFLRVLGVSEEGAAKHDDEVMIIEEKFAKYLEFTDEFKDSDPKNKTIH